MFDSDHRIAVKRKRKAMSDPFAIPSSQRREVER
jgi:hypothetical protein